MTLSLTVIDATVHLLVPLHKNTLKHLDKLQRNNQRNWNESVVKNVIRAQRYCSNVETIHWGIESYKFFKSYGLDAPEVTINGTSQRTQDLKDEDYDDHFVNHDFNIACFSTCFISTHHYRCLLPTITSQTDHPFCVFYLTPSV